MGCNKLKTNKGLTALGYVAAESQAASSIDDFGVDFDVSPLVGKTPSVSVETAVVNTTKIEESKKKLDIAVELCERVIRIMQLLLSNAL